MLAIGLSLLGGAVVGDASGYGSVRIYYPARECPIPQSDTGTVWVTGIEAPIPDSFDISRVSSRISVQLNADAYTQAPRLWGPSFGCYGWKSQAGVIWGGICFAYGDYHHAIYRVMPVQEYKGGRNWVEMNDWGDVTITLKLHAKKWEMVKGDAVYEARELVDYSDTDMTPYGDFEVWSGKNYTKFYYGISAYDGVPWCYLFPLKTAGGDYAAYEQVNQILTEL